LPCLVKGVIGREEAHVGRVIHDELAHALPQHCADQDVRAEDDRAPRHRLIKQPSNDWWSCADALRPPCEQP
jgi:hypothetical protein